MVKPLRIRIPIKSSNEYKYEIVFVTGGEDPDKFVLASFDSLFAALAHMHTIVTKGKGWHWYDDGSGKYSKLVRDGHDDRVILEKVKIV